MGKGISLLKSKIDDYRKKYYLNSLMKGGIQFIIVLGLSITFISILEHYFWFSSTVRSTLFFITLLGLLGLISLWVLLPLSKYLHWVRSDLDDHRLALEIGNKFPSINDKLLNALQLEQISESDNSLVLASIDSYLDNLKPVPFTDGIDYRVNFKYLRYLGFIMLSMGLFATIYPDLYTNSTKRVINYRAHYKKPLPFVFNLSLEKEQAFRNEPFNISVKITGESIPDQLYLISNDRKILLTNTGNQTFAHTFSSVDSDLNFYFEGGGFVSEKYSIPVFERAELKEMDILLDFPLHIDKKPEIVESGKLVIPEGTRVTWNIRASAVEEAIIVINDSIKINSQSIDNQSFSFNYQFMENSQYEVKLSNTYGFNKEKIKYQVSVLEDLFPELTANFYLDTVLYEYVMISGETTDDHGIRKIDLIGKKNNEIEFNQNIKQGKNQIATSYYYQLSLDSLFKDKGTKDKIGLYVSVKDNDAINGYKSTRSEEFIINLPNPNEIEKSINQKSEKTSKDLEKSINKAQSINEKIKQLQERLLSKQEMSWQEEKLLNELLDQRKKIEEEVKNLQQQFDELNNTEDKFNERSDELKEKAQKLQDLMDEVLDEETKKLYDELQKLMEENADTDELREQLNEIGNNEQNLEQELERALELFKRLKVESEIEKASNKLENLGQEQEELADKTSEESEKANNKEGSDSEQLAEEQENVNKQFDKIKEQIDQVQQLNQELKNPQPLQDLNQDMEDIKKGLEKAKDQLKNQDLKGGSEQQQQNSQKMKQMGQKLAQMMESMQMEMISEDIGNLRNILDNLVKLSFQQEDLIDEFYNVTQVDPRFVELSQDQLKLKDDAKVLEDSLLALSERVAQMSSFITREVGQMNDNIDASVTNLRNRDRNKALSNQQFAMASINNLALLLDDLLQQMQNSMASSMGKGKPQDKKGQGLPNLKELQKQLSQDIQQLRDSGKKGRQLSEKLAKMAAQQEMLRDKLNELQQSLKGQPGGKEAGDAMEKALQLMEQNEIDLVNKRLTQQLMDRQEEIMTRMLDAENAMKEQEFDNERKGETASDIDRTMPKAFQEYLLERKKQLELQKTIPIGLNPFYKKEVNDYFRRLSTEN